MKKLIVAVLLAAMCMGLVGCGSTEEQKFFSLDDFDNASLGVLTASTFETVTKERWPDANTVYYKATPDVQLALSQGKIDGFAIDQPMARYIVRETEGLTYLREMIEEQDYGFLLQNNQSGETLKAEIDEYLTQIIDDGTTLKEIDDIWFGTDESKKTVLEYEKLPSVNGTLKLATSVTLPPFAYLKDNRVVGYDIDIIARFCSSCGYALKIENTDFEGMLSGIESGRYDIAVGGIGITSERQENMLFTKPSYSGGIVMVVQGREPEFETAAQLTNRQIAKLEGSIFEQLFEGKVQTDKTWAEYKNIADGVAMLQSGKYVWGSLGANYR